MIDAFLGRWEKIDIKAQFLRDAIAYALLAALIVSFELVALSTIPIIDRHDSWNYFTNGLSIYDEGKVLFPYPGTLFSIFSVFIVKGIFNSIQPSMQIVVSIIGVAVFIVALYKLMRIEATRIQALLFLVALLFLSPFRMLQSTLIRPLTDVWLLAFLSVSVLSYINKRSIVAGVVMGLGFLFRSQGFQLGILVPILGTKWNIGRVAKFMLSFFLTVVIVSLILHLMISLPGFDELDFYKKRFLDDFRSENLSVAVLRMGDFIALEEMHALYISLLINLISLFSNGGSLFKKMSVYSLAISSISLAGVFIMLVSTGGAGADTRYFIYPMVFSSAAAYLFIIHLYERLIRILSMKANRSDFIDKIAKFACVLSCAIILGLPMAHVLKSAKIDAIVDNATKFDFIMEGAPSVRKDCLVATEDYPYVFPYRFFGFTKVELIPPLEEFMRAQDNSKYGYLFFTKPVERPDTWGAFNIYEKDEIKDMKGVTFRKIWVSGTKSIQYALFERLSR